MDAEQSDEELVARYAAHADANAFRVLFNRYVEKVSRIAAAILGTRLASDVEDVVQDIFIRVLRGLPSYRAEAKFSTWIFRVAYNQSITHKKRYSPNLANVAEASASDIRAREGNPADAMDTACLRTVLDRAIDRLPAEYQTAVRLHYWFGVPIAEIAEQLGAPENTIKSWLHRARKLLAHNLQGSSHLL